MLVRLLNTYRSALRLVHKPIDLKSRPPRRVQVLIAQDSSVEQHQLLVSPVGAAAEVPDYLRHLNWRHLATTNLREKFMAPASPVIEAEIGRRGILF